MDGQTRAEIRCLRVDYATDFIIDPNLPFPIAGTKCHDTLLH